MSFFISSLPSSLLRYIHRREKKSSSPSIQSRINFRPLLRPTPQAHLHLAPPRRVSRSAPWRLAATHETRIRNRTGRSSEGLILVLHPLISSRSDKKKDTRLSAPKPLHRETKAPILSLSLPLTQRNGEPGRSPTPHLLTLSTHLLKPSLASFACSPFNRKKRSPSGTTRKARAH
jgi:hypothetical protein